MDFVDSVSKPFKKLKHRFKEHRHKREGGSRDDNRGAGEHDAEGSQTGQSSLPPPEAEGMAESGPSGEKRDGDDKELVQGDPPASGPSVSPSDNAKANGTWAVPLIVPLLTIPSTNLVTPAIPDPGQEVPHPDKGEQNVADEKKSDWKSTASATAKLLLRGVRDTADAFGPLKSVAGGLCFILDNCEV